MLRARAYERHSDAPLTFGFLAHTHSAGCVFGWPLLRRKHSFARAPCDADKFALIRSQELPARNLQLARRANSIAGDDMMIEDMRYLCVIHDLIPLDSIKRDALEFVDDEADNRVAADRRSRTRNYTQDAASMCALPPPPAKLVFC